MSALFHYIEKLQAERIRFEDGRRETLDRQVEIFTNGGKLFLRIGPPADDSRAEPAVDIELSLTNFGSLRSALRNAGKHAGFLA